MLRTYFVAEEAGVIGIGGPMWTLGLLRNVPLHVGSGPVNPQAVVFTTFYVLAVDDAYSRILGREFLKTVQGLVDVPCNRL